MSKKHPMPLLTVRQEQPETLLDLLGYDEDSITLAIAWALAHSPRFLREFLAHTVQWRRRVPPLEIRVQDYEQGRGITDLELVAQGEFHLIVEAKRGWVLPGRAQLSKYARRASFAGSPCPLKRIVTLSECSLIPIRSAIPAHNTDPRYPRFPHFLANAIQGCECCSPSFAWTGARPAS